jgi:hypothetical protein
LGRFKTPTQIWGISKVSKGTVNASQWIWMRHDQELRWWENQLKISVALMKWFLSMKAIHVATFVRTKFSCSLGTWSASSCTSRWVPMSRHRRVMHRYLNGHFRNLNWRDLPYIRPM